MHVFRKAMSERQFACFFCSLSNFLVRLFRGGGNELSKRPIGGDMIMFRNNHIPLSGHINNTTSFY